MQKLFQSIALVQKKDADGTRCLLKSNEDEDYLRFIVGDRLEKESFRETAIREVGWQLKLDRKTDFLVSSIATLSMEFVDTLPGDDVERHIALAFYPVHIYRKGVIERLETDQTNRWVSAAEVCAGQTKDEQIIDPLVVQWINKWEVIQPWQ